MRDLTDLCRLAKKHKCNKGGRHTFAGSICHEYTPIYNSFFEPHREDMARVLEIGVNTGASLLMWQEYFPNAVIYGIDNKKECLFSGRRIETLLCDQSDKEALIDVGQEYGPFDVIIDDGSHLPQHQIISMQVLLPYLSGPKYYIIEDILSADALAEIVCAVPRGYDVLIVDTDPAMGEQVYLNKLVVIHRE